MIFFIKSGLIIDIHNVADINKRPALVRCSMGSVADSVGAKVSIISGTYKKNTKFLLVFL
ncbi:MAG: hypothetical protein II844_03485 [Prevotella sp.]|nr:hypothetical protein [Prevotella sp.]